MENGKVLKTLSKEIAGKADNEKISTIITFKSTANAAEKEYIKNLAGSQSIKHDFSIIPSVAADLTPKQIDEIASLDNVSYIEYDGLVHIHLNTARPSFGVNQAVREFHVTGSRNGYVRRYTRNDVVIAVIDTGIDTTHVDLADGKVIGWFDVVNGRATPYDDEGHGTHVSGIAAGAGIGKWKYRGVAFGAALVGVKVLDATGSGSFSQVIAGVQWCVDNRKSYNIRVINMSIGGPSNQPLKDAINNAVNAGIAVCVSAGNEGPGRGTIGSPGDAEEAITVGAMADLGKNGFYLANFSSRGPTSDGRIKPDICGPGVDIMAARANTVDQYIAFSGTSMSSPFVAGVAALMLDANPYLTPQQVKSILARSAIDWAPMGQDIDYGYGRLEAFRAIKTAKRSGCAERKYLPNVLQASGTISQTNHADWYDFEVSRSCTPVAVTMIIPDWVPSAPDLDITVYDVYGNFIASSSGVLRQETVKFNAACCGRYKLQVYSFSGSGSYHLNISVYGGDLELLERDVAYRPGGNIQSAIGADNTAEMEMMASKSA